ncbi:MAG: quinolinate synthase NadA [Prolixibacteraceae bacterium]|jgi:quinolinate synthase|nr:quinolinate synthase NadA [Prolixibacteraceae bacterium]
MEPIQIKEMLDEKGFIDMPISDEKNIVSQIEKLKKEKNAVILGHFYLSPELQDISDFLGDSLALARKAQETDADIIVFLGVHFMGETAKILNPNKKVIIPDLNAGCSLAESAPKDAFAKFKSQYPDHQVISYINCTADIKTLTDVVVTSSNARQIVDSFPQDAKLIFAPDKNLGNYMNSVTGRDMVLWDGACMVHEKYSLEKIVKLMDDNKDAKFIAHPECEQPVLLVADFVGSTTALLNYVKESEEKKFIIATESGILHQMRKECPDKILIPAPSIDSTCGCNDCTFMKLNTLPKLYNALKYEQPEVLLSEETIEQAKAPILRMLELSK